MTLSRNHFFAAGAAGLLAAAPGALVAAESPEEAVAKTPAASSAVAVPGDLVSVDSLQPLAHIRASRAERRLERTYRAQYRRAERRDLSPGRDIVEDGVRDGRRARPATRRELRTSIVDLRQMLRDGRSATTGAASGGSSGSTAGAGLEAIAACESGGDPSAVGGGGQYRGKYQFDRQTWQSVGGSGDPAAAPEAEQDRRAAALIAQSGSNPWPNCGG